MVLIILIREIVTTTQKYSNKDVQQSLNPNISAGIERKTGRILCGPNWWQNLYQDTVYQCKSFSEHLPAEPEPCRLRGPWECWYQVGQDTSSANQQQQAHVPHSNTLVKFLPSCQWLCLSRWQWDGHNKLTEKTARWLLQGCASWGETKWPNVSYLRYLWTGNQNKQSNTKKQAFETTQISPSGWWDFRGTRYPQVKLQLLFLPCQLSTHVTSDWL